VPYIPQGRRKAIRDGEFGKIQSPGELNFQITDVCIQYADFYGEVYSVYNEIIGALECAKQEFYRKMVAPYEDLKCEKNGEVF